MRKNCRPANFCPRLAAGWFLILFNFLRLLGQEQADCNLSMRILDDSLVVNLLRSRPLAFQCVLDSADRHEVQILYIQIDRNRRNIPCFTQHSYRLNSNAYFNPASLVKLPVVCLAFQKLNALKIPGLSKDARFCIRQTRGCPTGIEKDKTAREGYPSIAHLAKKMLIASDNEAYSQMIEFLGWDEMHQALFRMGYKDIRITRRFSRCDYEENRYTNPISFFGRDGRILFYQPSLYSDAKYENPLPGLLKGKRHVNERYELVNGPYDYTHANNMGLEDATDILRSVLFPESFAVERRFFLMTDDYRFLYKFLSILPRESDYPSYRNRILFPDNVKKYFLYGDYSGSQRIDGKGLRIFNVVGFSDGYLSDCAYVADFENKIEFFLSAVIYVNEDEIIRDGTYEYSTVGLPFLAELGRTVYDYEKKRKKWFLPDLRKFRIDYKSR